MTKPPDLPLDPITAVKRILDHNESQAPIDYVEFARLIVSNFGGIDELAKKLVGLVNNCEGDQAALRGMASVMDLLNKAHDRQDSQLTVASLTDDELEACVRELVFHGDQLVSQSDVSFGE